MKCIINRDKLYKTLQRVSGVVEKRHSQPILSYFLLQINSHQLRAIGTDLDIEVCALMTLEEPTEKMVLTVPARKILDICRALPENSTIELEAKKNKVIIKAGKSRFSLATLDADNFPIIDLPKAPIQFVISQAELKKMLERTVFAIANQDVRYYLNGLLLQLDAKKLNTVGTDGHRLSMFSVDTEEEVKNEVIVPRKGVNELLRLLEEEEGEASVYIGEQYLCVKSKDFIFKTKIIEGKFPDYEAVIPHHRDVLIDVDRDVFKKALVRVSILSNEKYRSVQMQLKKNNIFLLSKNPEQEEAVEEVPIKYSGKEMEIAFNVNYFIDVLNHIPEGEVTIALSDPNSSILIRPKKEEDKGLYVIMPMRF